MVLHMARTKANLGGGTRLADYLSASLLARVYPAEQIDVVLREHSAQSQRERSLPMRTMCYYCVALSLYPECAYVAVFEALAEGLNWCAGPAAGPLRNGSKSAERAACSALSVSKSSVSAARAKLGIKPLKSLHARCCVALAEPVAQPEAFYAGLRLVAMDGSHFELPDEASNVKAFGRPGSRTGFASYPQAQCALLVECATHAILAAEIGAYRDAEWDLCERLLPSLHAGMLCLADRGFNGVAQWQKARATGAHLLWRTVGSRILPVMETLCDGSYLSVLYPPADTDGQPIQHKNKFNANRTDGVTVRVIEYSLPELAHSGNDRGDDQINSANHNPSAQPSGKKRSAPVKRYRLISSLLDPLATPALELARVYHERWEVEAVFDELKTHLVERRRCLRSKTAEGVRQEFYGWVLAHYAVCWLMHAAASKERIRIRTLSFTGNLRLIRITQPLSGAFPPSASTTASSRV